MALYLPAEPRVPLFPSPLAAPHVGGHWERSSRLLPRGWGPCWALPRGSAHGPRPLPAAPSHPGPGSAGALRAPSPDGGRAADETPPNKAMAAASGGAGGQRGHRRSPRARPEPGGAAEGAQPAPGGAAKPCCSAARPSPPAPLLAFQPPFSPSSPPARPSRPPSLPKPQPGAPPPRPRPGLDGSGEECVSGAGRGRPSADLPLPPLPSLSPSSPFPRRPVRRAPPPTARRSGGQPDRTGQDGRGEDRTGGTRREAGRAPRRAQPSPAQPSPLPGRRGAGGSRRRAARSAPPGRSQQRRGHGRGSGGTGVGREPPGRRLEPPREMARSLPGGDGRRGAPGKGSGRAPLAAGAERGSSPAGSRLAPGAGREGAGPGLRLLPVAAGRRPRASPPAGPFVRPAPGGMRGARFGGRPPPTPGVREVGGAPQTHTHRGVSALRGCLHGGGEGASDRSEAGQEFGRLSRGFGPVGLFEWLRGHKAALGLPSARCLFCWR